MCTGKVSMQGRETEAHWLKRNGINNNNTGGHRAPPQPRPTHAITATATTASTACDAVCAACRTVAALVYNKGMD